MAPLRQETAGRLFLYAEVEAPYLVVLLPAGLSGTDDDAVGCPAAGVPTVFYMCGDAVPRLPRLAEMGPTALAVEESKEGFVLDLAQIAAQVGPQMALFGNLDATAAPTWREDELIEAMRAQRRAARAARGFVFSVDSPFPTNTPPQQAAVFLAAPRRAGPGGGLSSNPSEVGMPCWITGTRVNRSPKRSRRWLSGASGPQSSTPSTCRWAPTGWASAT
ncbi:MAG: hypothetical protein GX605_08910 [Chloroflexi bacterium]|nr:hypothetical protein [Chloroflexota bacterium]